MKLWTVVLVGVLTLLLVPLAGADDPPSTNCDIFSTNTPIVKLTTNPDCTIDLYVNHDLACFHSTSSTTYTVGPVRVTYFYCPPGDAAEPAMACPTGTVPLFLEGSRAELHADCTATVFVTPDIVCVGAWIGHASKTVGPVTVDATYCRPPNEPW